MKLLVVVVVVVVVVSLTMTSAQVLSATTMNPTKARDHLSQMIGTFITETNNLKVDAVDASEQSSQKLREAASVAGHVKESLTSRLMGDKVDWIETDSLLAVQKDAVEKAQKKARQLKTTFQNETTVAENKLAEVKNKIERSKEDDKTVGALYDLVVSLRGGVNLSSTHDNTQLLPQVREGTKRHGLVFEDQALMQLLGNSLPEDTDANAKPSVEKVLAELRQEIHNSLVLYEQQYTNLAQALVEKERVYEIEMEEASEKLRVSRASLQKLTMTQAFLKETIETDNKLLANAIFVLETATTELANLEVQLTATNDRLDNRLTRLADTLALLNQIRD